MRPRVQAGVNRERMRIVLVQPVLKGTARCGEFVLYESLSLCLQHRQSYGGNSIISSSLKTNNRFLKSLKVQSVYSTTRTHAWVTRREIFLSCDVTDISNTHTHTHLQCRPTPEISRRDGLQNEDAGQQMAVDSSLMNNAEG